VVLLCRVSTGLVSLEVLEEGHGPVGRDLCRCRLCEAEGYDAVYVEAAQWRAAPAAEDKIKYLRECLQQYL
jgi:hypothetical protein